MYNILVVDDNKTNLQLVKQVLSEKYCVIPVLSGKMALQYIQKKKPDLILLDLLMPEMDGRETMKAIRELPNGGQVPVIILTADTDKNTEVECLRLGASDFIAKPFVPEVMISRIDKTIELDMLRNQLEEKLTEKSNQASTDPLTEIPNRRYFENQVTMFLRDKSNRGSFFMIDLDNFKSINDSYGHMAGDHALKLVASMLRKNARDSDIICRMGGDEFAMFFSGLVSKKILRDKADRIMKNFSEMMFEEEALRLSTLSIGIAVSGVDGVDYKTLYEKADKSLYYVKQNGKNAFHFYSGESDIEETSEDKQLSADIRNLMMILDERENAKGVLKVGYNDFQRIYNFVSRWVQRSMRPVHILLITVQNIYGDYKDVDALEESVEVLEKSINETLRRADVSTRYSSSQFIVIIVDADDEGAEKVIQRIEQDFVGNNENKDYILTYEKAQI